MSWTRRQFVFRSPAAVAAAVVTPAATVGVLGAAAPRGGRPKRVIHLVADGTSLATLSIADHFSRLERLRPLVWTELCRRPGSACGLVDMRSLNSLVTDSAAASSSWGSGSRVKNGTLNVLPDGRSLRTLAELFGDAGWARGLVTTTEITHATPAGFASNMTDRGSAEAIALQYLDRQIEVLLGGGRDRFAADKRSDKRDVKRDFRGRGYQVVETKAALGQAAPTGRLLGIFAGGHLPLTVDHQSQAPLRETVPTLAEMTRAALGRLEREGRFLLQVEGGRVDHAAHASDAASAVYDLLAFDDALQECLEFQQRHPETLLVVTTDHGTGNPGLNGLGTNYGKTPSLLGNLRNAKKSFSEMYQDLKKTGGKSAVGERVMSDGKTKREVLQIGEADLARCIGEATGYELPPGKATWLARHLAGDVEALFDPMNSPSALLGQVLANYVGVGWTGSAHTSDYVPLVASGPGAERFQGFLRNTDIFGNYTDLAGIRYRNPQLPLQAESTPVAAEVERWELA